MLGHYSAGFTLDTYTHIYAHPQRYAERRGGEDRRFYGNGHGQAGTGTARPAGGEQVQGDTVREGRGKDTVPPDTKLNLGAPKIIWNSG